MLGIAFAITSFMPAIGLADDQQIADFIKSRLQAYQQQGQLRGFNVDMTVERGVVWFKGHVSNEAQESLILQTAQQAGHLGVAKVVDDIEVAGSLPARAPEPQSIIAQSKESQSRAVQSKVAQPNEAQLKTAQSEATRSKEAQSNEAQSGEANALQMASYQQQPQLQQQPQFQQQPVRQQPLLQQQPQLQQPQLQQSQLQQPQLQQPQLQVQQMQMQQLQVQQPQLEMAPSPMAYSPMAQTRYQMPQNAAGVPAQPVGRPQEQVMENPGAIATGGSSMPMPMAFAETGARAPMMDANCGPGMGGMGGMGGSYGGQMPMGYGAGAMGTEAPNLPGYAWPGYAAHPNYGQVNYPKQYSASAWPYIGPFYPYPQVPLGWRKVSLEWDDGWWFLDFHDKCGSCR
jgi:hypothetical protein